MTKDDDKAVDALEKKLKKEIKEAVIELLDCRAAWLGIFVVGCSLPCDPPVGGHSCNGGIIPRFHRAVCD